MTRNNSCPHGKFRVQQPHPTTSDPNPTIFSGKWKKIPSHLTQSLLKWPEIHEHESLNFSSSKIFPLFLIIFPPFPNYSQIFLITLNPAEDFCSVFLFFFPSSPARKGLHGIPPFPVFERTRIHGCTLWIKGSKET